MGITRLPSGSYRIKKQVNGKVHSVVLDHKPTKHEYDLIIAEIVSKKITNKSAMRFGQAAQEYVDTKAAVLSPSTVREYTRCRLSVPDAFNSLYLSDIEQSDVQTLVSRYSRSHAPKTTRNYYGFIVSVIKFYLPDKVFKVKLPQKDKSLDVYIPSKEDVSAIMHETESTEYGIAIALSAMGLRRSEICALTMDDVDFENSTIRINKALVLDKNNHFVVKQTKTTASTRIITVPRKITDMIKERGYIYKGHPESINIELKRVEKRLGIPQFTVHKMRHFFASYMHELGYSDKQIQDIGGWENASSALKNIYKHSMDLDNAKARMADDIGNIL